LQVDPTGPMLKPPGIKHFKLNSVMLLSTLGFNFNLRRYATVTDFGCSKLRTTMKTAGPRHYLTATRSAAHYLKKLGGSV
jgi:hypothetical protein